MLQTRRSVLARLYLFSLILGKFNELVSFFTISVFTTVLGGILARMASSTG